MEKALQQIASKSPLCLTEIHAAKVSLLSSRLSLIEKSEQRIAASSLWNQTVHRANVVKVGDQEGLRLIAYTKDLAFHMARISFGKVLEESARTALAFLRINEFGHVKEHLGRVTDLRKDLGVMVRSRSQLLEILQIYHAAQIILNRIHQGNDLTLSFDDDPAWEDLSDSQMAVMSTIIFGELKFCSIPDENWFWSKLMPSKQKNGSAIRLMTGKYLLQSLMKTESLSKVGILLKDEPELEETFEGKVAYLLLHIDDPLWVAPRDLKIPHLVHAMEIIKANAALHDLCPKILGFLNTFEKTIKDLNTLSNEHLIQFLELKIQTWKELSPSQVSQELSSLQSLRQRLKDIKTDSIQQALFKIARSLKANKLLRESLEIFEFLYSIAIEEERKATYQLHACRCYLDLGLVDESFKVLEGMPRTSSFFILTAVEIGLQTKDRRLGSEELKSLLNEVKRPSIGFYLALAKSLFRGGQVEEAIFILETGSKDFPHDQLILKGIILLATIDSVKNYELLLQCLEKVEEIDEDTVAAVWNSALTLFNGHAYDLVLQLLIILQRNELFQKNSSVEKKLMFYAMTLESFLLNTNDKPSHLPSMKSIIQQAEDSIIEMTDLPLVIPRKMGGQKAIKNETKKLIGALIAACQTFISILGDYSDAAKNISRCAKHGEVTLKLLFRKMLSSVDRIPLSYHVQVLALLIEDLLQESPETKIVEFLMLSRGLLMALLMQEGREYDSLQVIRQIQEVIKLKIAMPNDELYWFMATCFNISHAQFSMGNLVSAKEFCEASLFFMSSIPEIEQETEQIIRSAYADILTQI